MTYLFSLIGASLLIGLSLGLLGAGGSILTVPAMIYLLGLDEKAAIISALVIVGLISLVSSLKGMRKGRVAWRLVLGFGLPGIVGAYGGALIGAALPHTLQITVFIAIMLLSAWRMFLPPKLVPAHQQGPSLYRILTQGVGVGVLTGVVGVGGGFLIVPALVMLGQLPMGRAVPTSLVVIALNALVAFIGYFPLLAQQDIQLDYLVISSMSGIGVLASLLGQSWGAKLPQRILKRGFASMLVLIALFMGIQQWW